jgi:3-methyladenine DNA glycosylase AlkD
MNSVVQVIRQSLKDAADPVMKQQVQRFFKEKIVAHGVRSAALSHIVKQHGPVLKKMGKAEAFAVCEALFASGYLEEACIAAKLADRLHKSFVAGDIEMFERWINTYIDNWASCDTFCNHAVGTLVAAHPQHLTRLKAWTRSANRWVRRASAVSLIVPAKKGLFLPEVFAIADSLLLDGDDMVQKGYGWLLKAASAANQDAVFAYVMKHKEVMPRTALRYAIEKMPTNLKNRAMARSAPASSQSSA